ALLAVMHGEDATHRRQAAQILVPVYETEHDAQKLIEVYRVLIETTEDPVERLDVIEQSIDIAEEGLNDGDLAFELALRAIREGAGHTDLAPWVTRLETLAARTGRRK